MAHIRQPRSIVKTKIYKGVANAVGSKLSKQYYRADTEGTV